MASRQTLTLSAAGSLRLEVYEFSCRPRAANIFSATAVKAPSHVCELPGKTPITSQTAQMFVDLHRKVHLDGSDGPKSYSPMAQDFLYLYTQSISV